MRKKLETEERDATSRASFKCPSCCKTFTDLEVCNKVNLSKDYNRLYLIQDILNRFTSFSDFILFN